MASSDEAVVGALDHPVGQRAGLARRPPGSSRSPDAAPRRRARIRPAARRPRTPRRRAAPGSPRPHQAPPVGGELLAGRAAASAPPSPRPCRARARAGRASAPAAARSGSRPDSRRNCCRPRRSPCLSTAAGRPAGRRPRRTSRRLSSRVTRSCSSSVAGVAAQVEGQADAAQRRDLARPREILLLAAAPAVHEQHAGDQRSPASTSVPAMRWSSTGISIASSRVDIGLHQGIFGDRPDLRVGAAGNRPSPVAAACGPRHRARPSRRARTASPDRPGRPRAPRSRPRWRRRCARTARARRSGGRPWASQPWATS